MRVAPAFGAGGGSRFAEEYARGTLPCHIDHGTCRNRITWEVTPDQVGARRDGLLGLCADGLRESRHPHATVARLAFADLAALEGSGPISEEALRHVMAGLRLALLAGGPQAQRPAPKLGATRDGGVFESALLALRQISAAEGPRLVPHLHLVLPPIGHQLFSRCHRELIQEVLREVAARGGPEAEKVMRTRGIVLQ